MSLRVRGGFDDGHRGRERLRQDDVRALHRGARGSDDGQIELDGERLPYGVRHRAPNQLKKIQMVFQNPDASLNPQHTVGESVARPLILLGQGAQGGNSRPRASRCSRP